nr:reverse transcriptase domain-containing protein [Tanacetum cinerariifolium]
MAWDRYKDLLRACPHHGFIELHQLDTFYNALNPADQDSLNSAAGCNLLERRTQDVLTIIENKSKVRNSRYKSVVSQVKSCDANSNSSSEIAKLAHAVNQQTSHVTTAITAILKQFQATPPPASVKVVKEIYVTCGGAHLYYQCLIAGGNTFPELRDNIQGCVSAATVNYNQGNSVYRPLGMANKIRPPGFDQPNVKNNQNRFSQPQGYNRGNNFNQDQSYQAPTQQNQTSLSNQTNEIKNMMASLFQMNIASTSSSGSLPSNTVANPKGKLKAITTRSGIILDGPTVPIPPPFINSEVDERVEETLTKQDLSEYTIKAPPPPVQKYKPPSQRDFVKLPEKLGDPGKFLILCGFKELKCKALADLDASINLMPLSIWKKLCLPELISTRMTRELANQAICTPVGIARDVFVPVGKFTFPVDFVIVDYESDPRILIPPKIYPPLHVNQLSGSTTYSSSPNQLLEEFADELTLIIFPPEYDDELQFDIESDLKEIEYLLHHDPIKDIHSILKDSIDQSNLAELNNNLVDSIPEMFTDEHALDYSSPPLFDEYDDDFFEVVVDALPSTNNEDKVFNPGILIQKNFFEIITRVVQDKKLVISHPSLMIKNFDPPLYELTFLKEVPRSKMQLPFSSENEEKVFKPRIHTFEKVHSSLILELSH